MASDHKQQWREEHIVGMADAKVDASESHSAQRRCAAMHKAVQQVSSTGCLCLKCFPSHPTRSKQSFPGTTPQLRQGWPSAMTSGHSLPIWCPHFCCGTWRECLLLLVEKGALEGLKVSLGRRSFAQRPGWAPARRPHITENNQAVLPGTRLAPPALGPAQTLALTPLKSNRPLRSWHKNGTIHGWPRELSLSGPAAYSALRRPCLSLA